MPIYAYRCAHCGHEKDVLQKLSDAPLTQCPACGKDSFSKQVTAAGFQLKGSGWYVTDFRSGNNGAKGNAANTPAKSDDASSSGTGTSNASDSAAPASTTSSSDAAKPAAGPSTSSDAA
ncbi:FmdB family transcriptional regulator [Caballeronia novacaledonica]|uniref:FmdB family transcriptional regulator n=1 Tax=Caballeronia novacaledonica TaxID=1544861 RepID=A0A2U3I4Z4_9BURK|nr:FmdB family zinc ribbon protein [Caballeronia novacaledonica]SPB15175.1 FmdB family transcriptional regulator [Caballeronia novacaledonica]